jgi:hypothetical protein
MDNSRTGSFRMLEMPVNVFSMDKHVLVDLIGTRGSELGALGA